MTQASLTFVLATLDAVHRYPFGLLELEEKAKKLQGMVVSNKRKTSNKRANLVGKWITSAAASGATAGRGPCAISYLAPEVLRGMTPTPESDIYSFALTMW